MLHLAPSASLFSQLVLMSGSSFVISPLPLPVAEGVYIIAVNALGTGLPSDQIINQIYQSIQSIQIRYDILADQSIQIQASMHLIYLISLANRVTTLELSKHPYFRFSEWGASPRSSGAKGLSQTDWLFLARV